MMALQKGVTFCSKKSDHFRWWPPSWSYYNKIEQYFTLEGALFDVFQGVAVRPLRSLRTKAITTYKCSK